MNESAAWICCLNLLEIIINTNNNLDKQPLTQPFATSEFKVKHDLVTIAEQKANQELVNNTEYKVNQELI